MANEPRSYGQDHHEKDHPVNLNNASVDEIANLPMVGKDRAEKLIEARPFNSWEDVEKVEGIGKGMVDDLKSGNATLE
jgi:competence protein ComEC